ncbi:MAG TPA: GDSL-type esterase/lipase family protein [Terriglobales bacterium]
MNSIAIYFVSGDSLYPGAVLLLIGELSPSSNKRWLYVMRSAAAWLGLALMVMACPPFPWAIDAIFLAAYGILVTRPSNKSVRSAATIVLVVLTVALSASELHHRGMGTLTAPRSDHLVVLGDSISAGMYTGAPAWPSVFERNTGLRVKNLSQPGARVSDGIAMAKKLAPEDRVVLIELGGNDLLSGVRTSEFARNLDSLLAKIAARNRVVAMFELPLLPHVIGYGRVQRLLAEKYGVVLIPKHYFAEILGGANATTDGLHLSSAGAQQMAALVAKLLSPVIVRPQGASTTSQSTLSVAPFGRGL